MNKNLIIKSIFTTLLLVSINAVALPAFPGAAGHGADTSGGRGGDVIIVNHLGDGDGGSEENITLREAIAIHESNPGQPSTIIFNVGGVIEIDSRLEIQQPYLTIAGQTASGDGITIKRADTYTGQTFLISTHDVILRYLKIRPGLAVPPENTTHPIEIAKSGDALAINAYINPSSYGDDVYNIIIDHCSLSWASDGNLDITHGARDVTVQNSIISEALILGNIGGRNSYRTDIDDPEALQKGKGSLVGDANGSVERITFHNNLIAHNQQRNPKFDTKGDCIPDGNICTNLNHSFQLLNNVIYNWNTAGTYATANSDAGIHGDIIGNFYKRGRSTTNNRPAIKLITSGSGEHQNNSIFVYNNIDYVNLSVLQVPTVYNNADPACYNDVSGDCDDWVAVQNYTSTSNDDIRRSEPWGEPSYPVTVVSPEAAYDSVLENVGAAFIRYDASSGQIVKYDVVDDRVINDVINLTGYRKYDMLDIPDRDLDSHLVTNDSAQVSAAKFDSDGDGIADAWEHLHGDLWWSSTPHTDLNEEGYTYFEQYLHELTIDTDGDGFVDALDNCPEKANPNQVDSNSNYVGNVCDVLYTQVYSQGIYEGQVTENTSTYDETNSLKIGDDFDANSIRAIFTFDLAGSMPDGANIESVNIRVVRSYIMNTPFDFTPAFFDMSVGGFGGDPSLAISDYDAVATVSNAAVINADKDLSYQPLTEDAITAISNDSLLQFRAQFTIPSSDNNEWNAWAYYNGHINNTQLKPLLFILYTMPDEL